MNQGRIHDWIRYVQENTQNIESQNPTEEKKPRRGNAPQISAPPVHRTPVHAAPVHAAPAKARKNAKTPQAAPEVKHRVRRRVETRAEMLDRLTNPTISLHEASVILNVCTATVRRYASEELLPHERTPGGQRRFRLRAVIALSRQLGGKRVPKNT